MTKVKLLILCRPRDLNHITFLRHTQYPSHNTFLRHTQYHSHNNFLLPQLDTILSLPDLPIVIIVIIIVPPTETPLPSRRKLTLLCASRLRFSLAYFNFWRPMVCEIRLLLFFSLSLSLFCDQPLCPFLSLFKNIEKAMTPKIFAREKGTTPLPTHAPYQKIANIDRYSH